MGLGGWFKISFVRTWTKTLSLLKLIFPSAFFDSREIFPLRNCLPALNLCLKTGGKRSKLSIWNMCLNNWDRVFCIQPVCFSTSLPLILFTRLHPPQHPANIPCGDPQKNLKICENIWKYRLPGCMQPNIQQIYLVVVSPWKRPEQTHWHVLETKKEQDKVNSADSAFILLII